LATTSSKIDSNIYRKECDHKERGRVMQAGQCLFGKALGVVGVGDLANPARSTGADGRALPALATALLVVGDSGGGTAGLESEDLGGSLFSDSDDVGGRVGDNHARRELVGVNEIARGETYPGKMEASTTWMFSVP
jgi:hypothetical protein